MGSVDYDKLLQKLLSKLVAVYWSETCFIK